MPESNNLPKAEKTARDALSGRLRTVAKAIDDGDEEYIESDGAELDTATIAVELEDAITEYENAEMGDEEAEEDGE